MQRSILLALAAVLAVLPVSLAAQAPVAPEQVVRIRAPRAGVQGRAIGTVLDVRADTLVVQTSEPDTIRGGHVFNQRVVPLSSVVSLEVPMGPRSRVRGAVLGGLAGTATGVAAVALHKKYSVRRGKPAPCEVYEEPCLDLIYDPYPRRRAVTITLVGTVIGTAAGAVWSGRRWRHVFPVAPDAGVTASGGARVGATLRF